MLSMARVKNAGEMQYKIPCNSAKKLSGNSAQFLKTVIIYFVVASYRASAFSHSSMISGITLYRSPTIA